MNFFNFLVQIIERRDDGTAPKNPVRGWLWKIKSWKMGESPFWLEQVDSAIKKDVTFFYMLMSA